MLATLLQYGHSDVSLCSVPSAMSLHSTSSDVAPYSVPSDVVTFIVFIVTSSGATLGLCLGSRPQHTSKAFKKQFWGSPNINISETEGTGKDQEMQARTQEKGLSRHQISAVRPAGRPTALLLM